MMYLISYTEPEKNIKTVKLVEIRIGSPSNSYLINIFKQYIPLNIDKWNYLPITDLGTEVTASLVPDWFHFTPGFAFLVIENGYIYTATVISNDQFSVIVWWPVSQEYKAVTKNFPSKDNTWWKGIKRYT